MYLFMVNVFVPGMVHTLSNMGRVPHATAPAEQGPPPTPR
jgi:hypothetical protein